MTPQIVQLKAASKRQTPRYREHPDEEVTEEDLKKLKIVTSILSKFLKVSFATPLNISKYRELTSCEEATYALYGKKPKKPRRTRYTIRAFDELYNLHSGKYFFTSEVTSKLFQSGGAWIYKNEKLAGVYDFVN